MADPSVTPEKNLMSEQVESNFITFIAQPYSQVTGSIDGIPVHVSDSGFRDYEEMVRVMTECEQHGDYEPYVDDDVVVYDEYGHPEDPVDWELVNMREDDTRMSRMGEGVDWPEWDATYGDEFPDDFIVPDHYDLVLWDETEQLQVEQPYECWHHPVLIDIRYSPSVYHQPWDAFKDDQSQVESETMETFVTPFGMIVTERPCPF